MTNGEPKQTVDPSYVKKITFTRAGAVHIEIKSPAAASDVPGVDISRMFEAADYEFIAKFVTDRIREVLEL